MGGVVTGSFQGSGMDSRLSMWEFAFPTRCSIRANPPKGGGADTAAGLLEHFPYMWFVISFSAREQPASMRSDYEQAFGQNSTRSGTSAEAV